MARSEKKQRLEKSALWIADRLAALPHGFQSERQWLIKADVSMSFFSNLRGTPTKPPSDPGVDQLRSVLKAARVTLPEFFLEEAGGKLAPTPTKQALEKAFEDALAEMPKRAADRPAYLAEVVSGILALPADRLATDETQATIGEDVREEDAPPRVATTQP